MRICKIKYIVKSPTPDSYHTFFTFKGTAITFLILFIFIYTIIMFNFL